ncbi:MAG: D-glycero-beta-D-manno-heptose-7-phosphate kinase [Holophagaceae bacterium]|nr:D-glycero-beta-D-manno-heptose-7-phosphate kinase [Holophagaceae bacterium]
MTSFSTEHELLSAIKGQKILVFGDLMLDEYLFGEVNRISPEAPVPVVRVTGERWVLGGAANVASNLRALGAEPLVVGVIGDDQAGERIKKIFSDQELNSDGLVVDSSQPTIIKTRVIGQHQQMIRIDREEIGRPHSNAMDMLQNQIQKYLGNSVAVIVSDYAKGTVCQQAIETIREGSKKRQIPWVVDPKPDNVNLYHGASALTPNTKELSELTKQPIRTDDEMIAASSWLVSKLGLAGLLVTRSEKGVALVVPEKDKPSVWTISTQAREVFDVSGAGDTVISTFTAALAAKASWLQAAKLANAAAGVVVGKMGTASTSPQEILDRLSSGV